jgi:hypothetical protein
MTERDAVTMATLSLRDWLIIGSSLAFLVGWAALAWIGLIHLVKGCP